MIITSQTMNLYNRRFAKNSRAGLQTTIKDVDCLRLYSTSAGPTAAVMWEWRSPNTLAPNTGTPARLQDSVGLRYVYDVNADARVNAAAFDLSTLVSGKSLPACPPACTCSRVSLPLHVCLLACLPACLLACLPTCHLPACMRACLPAASLPPTRPAPLPPSLPP